MAGCCIGLILYAILQFCAFVLILVGTPIDMFRAKDKNEWGNTECLTMWGLKTKCYSTKYETKTNDLYYGCDGRRNRFRAAEALAIISIVIYGVACLLGFIMLCCCGCCRWICLVLNILGIGSACAVWALMVNAYTSNNYKSGASGYCRKLKDWDHKYGAGFALFVTGWAVDIIAIIFLMLPC